jgi:hypothetical protein
MLEISFTYHFGDFSLKELTVDGVSSISIEKKAGEKNIFTMSEFTEVISELYEGEM